MSSHWTLTMALSAIEAEIWSGTRFAAVGLIEARPDGRVVLEFRTRAAMVSTNVTADDLGPDGVVGRLRAMWSIGPWTRLPLRQEQAEIFAGLWGDETLSAEDEATLTDLARQLEAIFA